ncbi:FaeA/PapI family transcriptional regulator [Escherichia coli]
MCDKIIEFLKSEYARTKLFSTREIARGVGGTFFLTRQHLIDLYNTGIIDRHHKENGQELWRLC